MPYPNGLRIILLVLSVSVLSGRFEIRCYPRGASAEPSPISLVVELDRATFVLHRGLKENWGTRDKFLTEFERTPNTDSAGRPVADAKKYVGCLMASHLRIHQTWDEGLPIGVEVKQAITEFLELRNELEQARKVQVAEFRRLPCGFNSDRKVVLSAGVAGNLLKTKVAPVYPADLRVSGTVVLQALISSEGRVESLRVISGHPMLQQAALDAVRQWTYRPYILNNMPVEFETTIDIILAPGRQP